MCRFSLINLPLVHCFVAERICVGVGMQENGPGRCLVPRLNLLLLLSQWRFLKCSRREGLHFLFLLLNLILVIIDSDIDLFFIRITGRDLVWLDRRKFFDLTIHI